MMAEHVRNAIHQLSKGEKIGTRGTPVISFWDMRPKWEKLGNAWEYTGSDGSPFPDNGNMIVPCLIKLVYFRMHDGRVCQLAYEIEPEFAGPIGSPKTESAIGNFMAATGIFPRKIA